MKDMHLTDILNRGTRPLTLLSVYKEGRWQFGIPNRIVRTVDQQAFYLVSEKFGLVKKGTTDPAVIARRGSPGDYVARDTNTGVYSVVTAAEYKRFFPAPNLNPPSVPTNSEQLKDPKFLTNILKGSESPVSNSKTTKPTPPNAGY